MAHVPLEADLVRGLEDARRALRKAADPMEGAALGDLLHERVRVEPLLLRELLEGLVHEGQDALAVGLLHAVLEGQREDRLDTGGAAGDHRDRTGRRDRGDGRVAHWPLVAVDRAVPVREWPT